MDINTTSIPLYEAAENPGCSVEKIRDLVLTDQASDSIGDKEMLRISGNLISLAQASRISLSAFDLLDNGKV